MVAFEHVAPDPGEHDPFEAIGVVHGCAQQRKSTQREADRSDRFLRQCFDDTVGEVRIRLGIVRLGCGAVAEEVDADRGLAAVLEERREAVALPGRLERPTPTVHQHHRIVTLDLIHRRERRTQ